MSNHQGVMVYVQLHSGVVTRSSLELLGAGRKLADAAGTWLAALILAEDVSEDVSTAVGSYRADRAVWLLNEQLDRFEAGTFAEACLQAVEMCQPEIFLFSATAQGRALAPRVAAAIPTGLTADCTSLEIDPLTGLLLQTRPAFGGNLMATIVCENRRPQIATVRPGVLDLPPRLDKEAEQCIQRIVLPERKVRLDAILQRVSGGPALEDAQIIVAAGRGTKGEKGIRLVRELADAVGGAVGFSRACVDMGWADSALQVGQTGRTVHPRIYIACGISGAVQHIVGMEKSKTIIAVNQDESAPIFEHAHYGVVGDLFEIIPEWIRQIHEGGQ